MANCLTCNKEFRPKPHTVGKYCSVKCMGIANKGNTYGFKKGHIPWNKGLKIQTNTGRTHFKKGVVNYPKKRTILTKVCEVCGEVFEKPYRFNIGRWKKTRFCSTKCSARGNSCWKGGITPINFKIRNSKKYQDWRKQIFERDDFTCQICGERGGKLRANHIKKFSNYPELRFDKNNGITICGDCDYKWVFNNESDWESYFNFNLETRRMPWPRL